jgi:hypothetical protein
MKTTDINGNEIEIPTFEEDGEYVKVANAEDFGLLVKAMGRKK